jgi:hypothetical protein
VAVANQLTARRKEEVGGDFFIPTFTWFTTRVFFTLRRKTTLTI